MVFGSKRVKMIGRVQSEFHSKVFVYTWQNIRVLNLKASSVIFLQEHLRGISNISRKLLENSLNVRNIFHPKVHFSLSALICSDAFIIFFTT